MRHRNLLSAVVITTLAVFLTGCSRNPVAPEIDLSRTGSTGAATISNVPEDPQSPDGGTPSSQTQSFLVTSEGTMTVGRWTLWFRKNSLTMPATITLRVDDPEAMDVHIEVQPAAANNFAQSVVLTANMSDVPGFDYSTGTMMVWSNGDWQQPNKKDVAAHPNQQNVVGHFTSLSNAMVTNNSGNLAAE